MRGRHVRSLIVLFFALLVPLSSSFAGGFQPPISPFPVSDQTTLPQIGVPNAQSAPESTSSLQITQTLSGPPYYGYTTFMAPSDPDLPIEELSTYVNFLHVRHNTYYDKSTQDFYHLVPNAEGLQRVRGTNIKLILKLDRYLVEPIPLDECCSHYGIPADECTVNICGFNEGELSELQTIVDPYRDVIEAIYVVNEPYKAENNYTEEFLSELVQQVKDIFPGYPIYINFLSPYYRSLEVPGEYPNIPENIDLIAFDAYFVPLPDQETWYKQMIGNDIAIIKDRANGRPVIFSSIAFRIDHEPPEGPDSRPELYQAQWDYELYLQHDLAGLRWFFYDYKTPIGTWYGASYWPDLIAKHKEIGQKIFGPSSSERAFLPLVVKPSVPEPPPPEPPGPIAVIKDILYGDVENGDRNLLDLYLPSNPVGRSPVIIWIHGGGLTTGDKSMAGQGLGLVYEGFALVGINYRLVPDAYLPTQIYDAKAAVRWVRAHADQYNLDPDNIGVLGGSAGAMISAGIGTSGDVAALEGDVGDNLGYSSRVQAAIALAGVYDFFNFFEDMVSWCQVGDMEHYDACYLHYFFGCSLVYESCWEALGLGSAISQVSPDDPPFFLCIGDADQTPQGLEDHINFHNALLAQGVDSTLTIPPGGVHGECYEREYDEILAFFNSHLRQ